MARRRFQDPKPQRLGKWWYLLTWQDEFIEGRRIRKRKRIKLALTTMPEREVRKIAAEMLRPLNQGLISIGSGTKFEDFVESVYKPTVLPVMAKTTQDRYVSVLKNYLVPAFGESCLRDVTPLVVQRYLSKMAGSPLSHESRDKIRDVLSSVLGSAVQFNLLVKNPVEGLKLPPPKKGKASPETRTQAARDYARGQTSPGRAPSPTRSRAITAALQHEGKQAASHTALSRQAHASARSRSAAARSRAAQKAVRTKGSAGLRRAARKAARTRGR